MPVTLKDGTSAPFTARLLPDPGRGYGLFRSQETFHGVRHLGGWIFNPPHFASARTGTGTQAALTSSPPVGNMASVTVPGLGTFRLTPCREAQG
jgi:hypothetical protein